MLMKTIYILLAVLVCHFCRAQVGIGTTVVNSSALLQLNSDTKGFLPPRMSSTSRNAILNPPDGLMVYDITTNSYWYYDNVKWIELAPAGSIAYKIPADRVNPNGAAGDKFGFSVCLGSTGTTALVGAPGDNSGAGACFRLVPASNNLWFLNTTSPAGGGLEAGDAYGFAVAMDRFNSSTDGVISAPFDDSATVANVGCAYFMDGSSSLNKVYAPALHRIANAKFGRSVDIAANTNSDKGFALIGAPGANGGKGAAFIYQYNPNTLSWEFEATLLDNFGEVADSFGLGVSLYYKTVGDSAWAFVGAPFDDDGVNADVGSVTAFRKAAGSNSWVRAGKFFPAAQTDDINFGYCIANMMQCKKLVIGAPGKSSGQGVIYEADLSVLNGSAGTFLLNIIPNSNNSSGNGSPGLGSTLSAMALGSNCDDFYMVAGSQSGLVGANSAANFGAARLFHFQQNAWTTVESFITDPYLEVMGYGFGRAVSLHTSNRNLIIGAPLQKVDGNVQQGKVQFVKF